MVEHDAGRATHQIGEVADLVGLSLRTIRHYGALGLAPPSARSAGGFRLYTDADVARLVLIRDMKPLAFSLEEMRDLLDARDGLAAAGPGRAEHVARLARYAETAETRCRRLRERLADAEDLAAMLRAESGAAAGAASSGAR